MPWLKRKFKRNGSETAQSGEKKWYKQKFGILLEPNNMDEGVDGMVCQIMGREETEVCSAEKQDFPLWARIR
jgi:hypothetical protein